MYGIESSEIWYGDNFYDKQEVFNRVMEQFDYLHRIINIQEIQFPDGGRMFQIYYQKKGE